MGAGTSRVKLLTRRHPLSRLSEQEMGRLVAAANFSTESCPARPDPRGSDETAASTVNPPPVADDKVWSRLTPTMSRGEVVPQEVLRNQEDVGPFHWSRSQTAGSYLSPGQKLVAGYSPEKAQETSQSLATGQGWMTSLTTPPMEV